MKITDKEIKAFADIYYVDGKEDEKIGFILGTKWMQRQIPQWVRVEEELPILTEEYYQILVKSSTGYMETYYIIDKKSLYFLREFIEWKYIDTPPTPPKIKE